MKTTLAVLMALVGMAPALAQTTQAPPPPEGPTSVQCRDGYKEGMPWTKSAFEQACAQLRAQKKP